MKVKRWQQKPVNREEWASVIKYAKALKGPQSQGVSKQASTLKDIYVFHIIFTTHSAYSPNSIKMSVSVQRQHAFCQTGIQFLITYISGFECLLKL